jgi:hypothetical protein
MLVSDQKQKTNEFTREQLDLIDKFIVSRSYVDAFRAVYPDCESDQYKTPVNYRASRAFTKPMRAEIARLDAIAEAAERKEIERAAKEAAKKWSKADSVDALVDVVTKCRKQIIEESERGEGVNTRVADTMRGTIDTLNKMLGYNEPDKQTVDSVVQVVFGGKNENDDHFEDSLEDFAE